MGGRDTATGGAAVGRDGAATVAGLFQDLAEPERRPGVTELVGSRERSSRGFDVAAIQVQQTELVCRSLVSTFGRNAIGLGQAARVITRRE
ncbi:MAG TPA: hypothetical protein VHX66_07410 [Solirubrobacteraceae bacterium]|nr:hypothetical protein [Solirubrobacteraceae bacterium]